MYRIQLLQVLVLVFVLACGFIAGRTWPDSRAERATVAYVEDCTLADAHAGRCAIPCGSEADCLAKNGRNDAY